MRLTLTTSLLPLLLAMAGCPHQVEPHIQAIRDKQCFDPAIMARDNPSRRAMGFTELDATWTPSHVSEGGECTYERGSKAPVLIKYVTLDEFQDSAYTAEREEWYFGNSLALKLTYSFNSSHTGVVMEVDDPKGTFLKQNPSYRIPNQAATSKDVAKAKATLTTWAKSHQKTK